MVKTPAFELIYSWDILLLNLSNRQVNKQLDAYLTKNKVKQVIKLGNGKQIMFRFYI